MTSFNDPMKRALEDTINQNIIANHKEASKDFEDLGFEVDYSLVDEGVHVTDKFISVIFDGTFHKIGIDDSKIQRTYNNLPYYEENGRNL